MFYLAAEGLHKNMKTNCLQLLTKIKEKAKKLKFLYLSILLLSCSATAIHMGQGIQE